MQIAFHPDGKSACLFYSEQVRLKACLCFPLLTVPFLFLVSVIREGGAAPRISAVHEYSAITAEEGAAVLVGLKWPVGTKFVPYVAFGAAS
mmetsp:Transcript_31981/g.79734  ORF Transcript_31981/g.79734 Transcript_31981/m.79734 type:complete len:91 (-) Transcript_31981:454-726(-)